MKGIFRYSIIISGILFWIGVSGALAAENAPATADESDGAARQTDPAAGSASDGDLQSGDWRIKLAAIQKLADSGESRAIPALLRLAGEDPDPVVAATAVSAVGSFRVPGPEHEVTDSLLKVFERRQESTVRYAVLLALASLGDEDRGKEILTVVETAEKDSTDPLLLDLARKMGDAIRSNS